MKTRKQILNGDKVALVNGRDIHRFVASGKAYRTWVHTHIDRGGMVLNKDYIVELSSSPDPLHGTTQPEFWFTFQAVAHIGAMTRGEHGARLRQYCLLRNKLQQQPCTHEVVQPAHQVVNAAFVPDHSVERLVASMTEVCVQLTHLVDRMEKVADTLSQHQESLVLS